MNFSRKHFLFVTSSSQFVRATYHFTSRRYPLAKSVSRPVAGT
jgi:hypothetical protein